MKENMVSDTELHTTILPSKKVTGFLNVAIFLHRVVPLICSKQEV